MFILFYQGAFKSFWQNRRGDVFLDATCRALKLNLSEVDLYYYPTLESTPAFYEADAEGKLTVYKKSIRMVEQEVVTLEGETETIQVEEEYNELDYTLEPEVFFKKGLVVKPC